MIVEEIKRQNLVQFQNIDRTAIYVFRGKDGEKLLCDTRVNWKTSDTPLFLSGMMVYFVLLHDIYYSSAMDYVH
jgi:hypothetical protein